MWQEDLRGGPEGGAGSGDGEAETGAVNGSVGAVEVVRLPRVTMMDVIRAAIAVSDPSVTMEEMRCENKAGNRIHRISHPRQRVIWLLDRMRGDLSLRQIGIFFGGRDHSTVHNAIKAVNRRLAGISPGKPDPGMVAANEREMLRRMMKELGIDDPSLIPPPAQRMFNGRRSSIYRKIDRISTELVAMRALLGG